MGNDLVKFSAGGLPANPEDLVKGLQNVASAVQTAGGVPFLRLLKSGYWVYGAENIEVQDGSLWAVNPASIQHGWACWGDSELLGESMAPFNQPAPPRNTLPDYGEEWSQQLSVQLQCMSGEDTGVNVLYKGTSLGLRNAVRELINELIDQLQRDPVNCVPVIKLEVDSYKHKKWGEVFTPVLEVVKWISFSGEAAGGESDEDAATEGGAAAGETPEELPEAAEAAPAGRRRRRQAAAVEDDEAAENEAPAAASTRRRRRRAAA